MSAELLTVPEASRRLGIEGPRVYDLIFAGELDGKPDRTGQVKVAASEVERYRLAHTGS
jgi:excisionase family DNA binding protein